MWQKKPENPSMPDSQLFQGVALRGVLFRRWWIEQRQTWGSYKVVLLWL